MTVTLSSSTLKSSSIRGSGLDSPISEDTKHLAVHQGISALLNAGLICCGGKNLPGQHDHNYTLSEKPAEALNRSRSSCGGAQNFGKVTTTAAPQISCSARQTWHTRIWKSIVDNTWQTRVVARIRGYLDSNGSLI